jgi:hypothetical protein
MEILITAATDILKQMLPLLISFIWEKANEPTTVEDAAPDAARRDRLLAAIRLRHSAGGHDSSH